MKSIRNSIFLLLIISGGFRTAFADVPPPPIDIGINLTNFQFDIHKGKLSDGGTPAVQFSVQPKEQAPAFGSKVDLYMGMLKPNGTIMTWIPGDQETAPIAKSKNGLHPLAKDIELKGSISETNLGHGSLLMSYQYDEGDKSGLYILFTLVVEAGKNPNDPSNWISSKTKIYPVNP